jgi:hypothetical protein
MKAPRASDLPSNNSRRAARGALLIFKTELHSFLLIKQKYGLTKIGWDVYLPLELMSGT